MNSVLASKPKCTGNQSQSVRCPGEEPEWVQSDEAEQLLARLFTAQCNPDTDSQLYIPDSPKMKQDVIDQVVRMFRKDEEKPLALTKISADDYFSLKQELELFEASGLLADFEDELSLRNDTLYLRVVRAGVNLMGFRYDIEQEAQDQRDQWYKAMRTIAV